MTTTTTSRTLKGEAERLQFEAEAEAQRAATVKVLRRCLARTRKAAVEAGDAFAAYVYFGPGGDTSARSLAAEVKDLAWETAYGWLALGGIRASMAALDLDPITSVSPAVKLSKDLDRARAYGQTEDAVDPLLASRLRAFADLMAEGKSASAAAEAVMKAEKAEATGDAPEAEAEEVEPTEDTPRDPAMVVQLALTNLLGALGDLKGEDPEAAADAAAHAIAAIEGLAG